MHLHSDYGIQNHADVAIKFMQLSMEARNMKFSVCPSISVLSFTASIISLLCTMTIKLLQYFKLLFRNTEKLSSPFLPV